MVSAGRKPRRAMPGIIVTAVMSGVSQHQRTYGAIPRYRYLLSASGSGRSSRYRRSFMISGLMTLVTVPFAVVPFRLCIFHWFINANRRQFSQILYLR